MRHRASVIDARVAGSDIALLTVSHSPHVQDAVRAIERAARADLPVLIEGEPGTGKSALARHLHDRSPHATAGLTSIDLRVRTTIADATAGTLVLAEPAALDAAGQSWLLRRLPHLEQRPVATSTDRLLDRVAAGSFRPDLYWQIAVVRVVLPPLRERRADLPLLLDALLLRHGGDPDQLDATARDRILRHTWPGNLFELDAVARRIAALGAPFDLPDEVRGPPPRPRAAGRSLRACTAELERRLIEEAIADHAGDRRAAARALAISYSTLRAKLARTAEDD